MANTTVKTEFSESHIKREIHTHTQTQTDRKENKGISPPATGDGGIRFRQDLAFLCLVYVIPENFLFPR